MRTQKNCGLILMGLSLIVFWENKKLAELGWTPFWPFFIMAGGLFFFLEYLERKEKGLLLPGILLTGMSLILFQFALGYLPWAKMAVFWPLLFLPLGLAYLVLHLVDSTEDGTLIPGGFFTVVGIIPLIFQASSLQRIKLVVLVVIIAALAALAITTRRERFPRSGRF